MVIGQSILLFCTAVLQLFALSSAMQAITCIIIIIIIMLQ